MSSALDGAAVTTGPATMPARGDAMMDSVQESKPMSGGPTWWPAADVRAQLLAGALMWLIGASILLVRGLGYIQGRSWHAWALSAGLILGVLKSRYMLEGVAAKAVARVQERGRAWFFGFFSARSWLLVSLMMGGGMLLRRLVVHPDQVGAGIMGAVYIGVGSALLLADRIFWHAAVRDPLKARAAAGRS